jgi:hypothetical protein
VLTECNDKPHNEENGANPCSVEANVIIRNIIQYVGPVFAGQNLIHAKEGIVDGEKSDPNRVAIRVLLRKLAAKELRCKYCGEEGQ